MSSACCLEMNKGRELPLGQMVQVYLNWNKGHSIYSILDCWTGLVAAYASKVYLIGVEEKGVLFRVREGGRRKVVEEQCKNVHAFVTGVLAEVNRNRPLGCNREVYYDPYQTEYFQIETPLGAQKVSGATIAFVENRRVYIP